jgi:hypothetical protein
MNWYQSNMWCFCVISNIDCFFEHESLAGLNTYWFHRYNCCLWGGGGRGPEIQDGGHETRENNKKHCDFHLYHSNQLIKMIKIFVSEMFPIK